MRCAFSIFASARALPRASATAAVCPRTRAMRVAVVGCAHGELDIMYDAVSEAARVAGPIDLVLCPGDFQAVRNVDDLQCMACPDKYKDMRSFWRYYSGTKKVPVPTVFVGGNHEASNHLQEIPLGGLVAPNIYFLGNAGVVSVNGLRIAGVSGVYTAHNYVKPRMEKPPYPGSQLKSVYHARAEDVARLKRLSRPVDVVLGHDWPRNITDHGDLGELLRHKPFLRSEIADGSFGNPGAAELLDHLQPRFWFAAHMHVKFPARVRHASGLETRFLALDKVLPRRDFLQILEIPLSEPARHLMFGESDALELEADDAVFDFDPEWLAILRTEATEGRVEGPVTDAEIEEVKRLVAESGLAPFLRSISDFKQSGRAHNPSASARGRKPQSLELQSHTTDLAGLLGMKLAISRDEEPAAAKVDDMHQWPKDSSPYEGPTSPSLVTSKKMKMSE